MDGTIAVLVGMLIVVTAGLIWFFENPDSLVIRVSKKPMISGKLIKGSETAVMRFSM